ncbi:MAG TPA: hypothetical protein VLJ17_13285 [Xanthobacteraceae bacterium]|nr:hypothetical protein [Xanthobacteraceae bacterium]
MTDPRCWSTIIAAATVALTSSVSTLAIAQSQDAVRAIANHEGIFIDAKSFNITLGKPKGDVAVQITNLGARELGPGAIIFRSDDKLYIVDAPPVAQQNGQRVAGRRDLQPWEIEHQRTTGLRDLLPSEIERQRPTGLRDLQPSEIERQRPTGLRDLQPSEIERQRMYMIDPEYAHYRLKKAFEEVWGTNEKK